MRTEELSKTQTKFKRLLLKDIKEFKSDVLHFREDFLRNGPMVDGIAPNDAVDRLSRFKEELKIRERKMDSYRGLGFLYLFTSSMRLLLVTTCFLFD
jgi:dynein heavy chain, axonemal